MANTGIIADGYFDIATDPDEGDYAQGLEDIVSLIKEMPGGTLRKTAAVVLASDAFAPVKDYCAHIIDTEGAAAADNLATITATGIRDGFIISLSIANSARVITVKNSGNIVTLDGNDLVMDNTTMEPWFRWDGTLTKWRQTTAPEVKRDLNKMPGTLSPTGLVISSGSITPTRGFHTVTSESGVTDDLDLATQGTLNYDGAFLMLKATSGHTIQVRYNQSGTGKFLQTSQGNEYLSGDKIMCFYKSGTTWLQFGSHGFEISYLIMSGGRFTPSSTVPVSLGTTNATTGYLLPYGNDGNRISLYDGANWNIRTFTNPSLAFTNAKYTLALRFAYDNAGVVTLEDQVVTTNTKTITGITAANPAVVTTSTNHGLSVGDWVAIDGVVGTIGTTTKNGVNSAAQSTKLFKVLATPSGTTFSFGLDTTGLAYTSGGTMYQIGAFPALGSQDGIPVKSGDATRRLIGAYLTGFTAGQCDCTADERFVVSALNQVTKTGAVLNIGSHTTNSNGVSKLADNDVTKRKKWLTVITDIQPIVRHHRIVSNGASAAGLTRVMFDALDTSIEYGIELAVGGANVASYLAANDEPVTTNTPGLHAACIGDSTNAASTATFSSTNLQAIIPW